MVIGVAIYVLFAVFAESTPEAGDERMLVVSSGEIEWMQTSWQQRWNRPPTEEELDGLIQQYIRETVLYREALTMGLNQHDQVIRRRLAQKLEYLAKDLVALAPPTEEELRAYFSARRDRYQQAPRYTFTQVFLDPDVRGDATLDDAERIKATLIAQGEAIEDPGSLGDGFMLQSYFPEKDPSEIQKAFGRGFAESLMGLPTGQWHGPVLSGYGTHVVYVSHVSEPPVPVFEDVRDRVTEDWKADKGEELNEAFYVDLRDRYTIVIDWPDAEGELGLSRDQAP